MDVLYAINAKKELAALNAPRLGATPLSETNSTISIAELLDYVNQYFPDILPEDVLKHYGYDARPDGKLGEYALYSDRDTESLPNRSLLANAFESVAQNDIEKQKIQEYKGKIDRIQAEEQKLAELNGKIKELSFAKGTKDTKAITDLQIEKKQTENRILWVYKKNHQKQASPGVKFSNALLSGDYSKNLSQFRQIVKNEFAGTIFEKSGLPKFSMREPVEYTKDNDERLKIVNSMEGLKFSDRDTESLPNRSLLVDALEIAAQNQIKELSFANGKRDKAKIQSLRDEAAKTANRINTYDRELLRMEASKPIQNVLEREKKAAYKRAEQAFRGYENP